MTPEQLKAKTLEGFERMFNQGETDYCDEAVAPDGVDHQDLGVDFAEHLKHVVTTLRTAFPDLHFEVHDMLAEGDLVATRSTMTGTHSAPLELGPLGGVEPKGNRIEVPHMHFFRYDDEGRLLDLWHVWNAPKLARDIGVPAPDFRVAAPD